MGETGLIHFDLARRELALATNIDEVKEIRDKAEALRQYARQAGLGLEMQNQCAEIKLRAERRAGELLAERKPHPPGPEPRDRCHDDTYPSRLEEIGISGKQSERWQAVARIPEPEFEKYIAEGKGKSELTTVGALRLGHKLDRQNAPAPPPFPQGKFSVVYADPPWEYDNSGFAQSAASQYPTMTAEAIQKLPVAALCTPASVLFLWATSPLLPVGLETMKAWGFEYKASLVWCKGRSPGMGWFVQTEHEFLLIGTREENTHPTTKPKSVLEFAPAAHSAKPVEVYSLIEEMYSGPYCELFARNERAGWEAWGNELP